MNKQQSRLLFSQVLSFGLCFFSLLFLLMYLFVALSRIAYPFELEWLEGTCVDQVVRILEGKQLYVEPSLRFISFVYTPVYFYVSALVSLLVGEGFFALRLVSFVSSLGIFALLFLIVWKETKHVVASICAVGLFAATYRITGVWLDIARVDSLFLFLFLLTIFVVRFYQRSLLMSLVVGLLALLTFLTKQTALFMVLAVLCGGFFLHRRKSYAIVSVVTFLSGVLLSTTLFNLMTDQWYSYYVFTVPRSYVLSWERLGIFLFYDTPRLLFALLGCFIYYFQVAKRGKYKIPLFYLLVLAVTFFSSMLSRMNIGGFFNVMLPFFLALALVFGFSVAELSSYFLSQERGKEKKQVIPLGGLWYLLCFLQFFVLLYNPLPFIPSREHREVSSTFLAQLERYEGDVFIFNHGYINRMLGKQNYLHRMTLLELLYYAEDEVKEKVLGELRTAIQEGKFAAIVLDDLDVGSLLEDLDRYYELDYTFTEDQEFFPTTGLVTVPKYIYVPRE